MSGQVVEVDVRVYSATSGKPLDALAWLSDSRRLLPALTASVLKADENGRLRFVAPRSAAVRLWAPSHQLETISVSDLLSRRNITLSAGGVADVRLHHQGQPLPDLSVHYCLDLPETCRRLVWLKARTDQHGHFRVRGVGSATLLHLRVLDPRFVLTADGFDVGIHKLALQPGATVRGQVVHDEAPIADLVVEALVPMLGGRLMDSLTTRSDAEGRFEIAGLPMARFLVGLRHKRFRPLDRWVDLTHLQPDARLLDLGKLELTLGRRAEIVVFGPEGPLASATASDPNTGEIFSPDSAGHLIVTGLPLAGPGVVEVKAEGHLPRTLEIPPDAPQPVEIRLRRGAGIVFDLLDVATGEPVPETRGKIQRGESFSLIDLENPAGQHRLGGLEPGAHKLTLEAPGFLPVDLELELAMGRWLDLGSVGLDRGAEVRGFLAGPIGTPLVSAKVSTVRPSTLGSLVAKRFEQELWADSDQDGLFRLSGLKGGPVCLTVSHPGIADTPLTVHELEPFAVAELGTVFLGSGTRVEGQVYDQTDEPVADIEIEMRAGALRNPCLRLRTRSDTLGRFFFPRVATAHYHLIARQRGAIVAVRRLEVPETDEIVETVLTLQKGRLSGTVRLNGEPTRGGTLLFRWRGAGSPPAVYISQRGRGAPSTQELVSDTAGKLFATVDETGRYETRGVIEPGIVRIDYEPPDGLQRYIRNAEIPSAATELELDFDFDGLSLAGWTIDEATNETISGTLVEARHGGRLVAETVSGTGGYFEMAGIPRGEVDLRATFAEQLARLTLNAEDDLANKIELQLRAGTVGEVQIVVRDEPGQAVAGALVYLTDGAEIHLFKHTDLAGRTSFPGLDPGRFRVLVGASGGVQDGGNVTLAGAALTVHSEVTFALAKRVRLEWADSKAGRRVELQTGDGLSLRPILTLLGRDTFLDELGSIVLPPLNTGEWQIRLPPDTGMRRVSVTTD